MDTKTLVSNQIIPKDKLIFTFTLTYILLITTGTITLIEALRTKIPFVRHIFNLETVISIIAGYFYSQFTSKINESYLNNKPIDWQEFVKTRYLDWAITTPLMLLVLIKVLTHHMGIQPKIQTYILIIVLNYTMLYLGYAGESIKNNNMYFFGSFFAFILMYGIIFYLYVKPRYSSFNYCLYFFFLIVWSIYGVVYKLDIRNKNIAYNILDLISKCFVGIGLWVYFAGLFKI